MKSLSDLKNIYGFGRLQDAANILRELSLMQLQSSDFISWIEKEILNLKLQQQDAKNQADIIQKKLKYLARRCPDCGDVLIIFPVNNSPRDDVGHGLKSAWQCRNSMGCGYELYSEKTVKKELKAYNDEFLKLYKRVKSNKIRS